MNNKKLRRKFLSSILIVSLFNVLVLIIWFYLRINPIAIELQEFKEEIINEKLQEEYSSYDNLLFDIYSVEEDTSVVFVIEDAKGNILIDKDVSRDVPLATDLIKAGDEFYLLKIYSSRGLGITKLIIELIFFQIIISFFILMIIYLCTRQFVLKPVDRIIEDIRNYKLGKKPKKREINNEFDLISNEFVMLTDDLDKEKQEQNRIIASISHDLKTPLTSIIGYSELLKEQDDGTNTMKYINKIYDKAMHIKDLLATFDDYIVNQDKVSLKLSNIQIKDIVNELNNDYKIELENKKIKFEVKSSVDNEYIDVDVVKLKRIFSNMITNSIRYLEKDGIISIKISKDNDYIKFKVSDNGCGVDSKIIDKIFDPLFTTDYSRKIHGLGLSICKEFVEMHGGYIKAYNSKGLTIEFTIPIKKLSK